MRVQFHGNITDTTGIDADDTVYIYSDTGRAWHGSKELHRNLDVFPTRRESRILKVQPQLQCYEVDIKA
jgi:hypothetical protein